MNTLPELCHQLSRIYGQYHRGEMVHSFTDKGSIHSYTAVYEKFMRDRRNKASILEIGIMTGGSLLLWKEYFKEYTIVGMDNRQDFSTKRTFQNDLLSDDNIHLYWNTDSTDPVPYTLKNMEFDFIVDDGDHRPEYQLKTFKNYWPLLKKGGHYFIEDMILPEQSTMIKEYCGHYTDVKIHHWIGKKNGRSDDEMIVLTKV